MDRKSLVIFSSLAVAVVLVLTFGFTQASTQDVGHVALEEESREALALRLAGGQLGWEGLAFVAGGDRNKIWVVDARFHKLVTTLDVEGPRLERTQPFYPNLRDVHAMVWPKDFSVLYTVNWYDYERPSQVIAYDPLTFNELWRAEAGLGGHHAALTPDDRFLYVANQYGDTVSVIDVAVQEQVAEIYTGFGNDYITPTMYWDGIAIDTPYLFVSVHKGSHLETGTVYAIDWRTHEVVAEIVLGGMVHGVNLTPDASQAWAAVMGENVVAVIDVATLEPIHRLPFAGSPIHLSFSPDGAFAYITTTGNQIYKIDTTTYETVWNVTGTTVPAHTGVTPDGREFWSLNHGMDTERYPYLLGGAVVSGIQMWDTETGRLISEVVVEGTPHEIQFVPYSAVGTPTPAAAPADDAHAEAIAVYNSVCFACHGSQLEGASATELQNVGMRLSEEEIRHVIVHGRGGMPGGLVSEADAEALAAWLAEMHGGHGGR